MPKICLELSDGWWSYQWCDRYEARQYHRDAEKGGLAVLHSLGTYSTTRATLSMADPPPSAASAPRHDVAQVFKGGTPCESSGGKSIPRSAEARFFCCETGTAYAASLLRVRESEACHYVMELCSPLACDALPPEEQRRMQASDEARAVAEGADLEALTGASALALVRALLKQAMGSCVVRHDGWWSYELCVGKRAQQFHLERGRGETRSESITARFTLGRTPKPASSGDALSLGATASGLPFVSQWLEDGTPCDISETPRRTQVLMFCAARAPPAGGGDEPSTYEPNQAVERLKALQRGMLDAEVPPLPTPRPQRYLDEEEAEEVAALTRGSTAAAALARKAKIRLIAITETATCQYRAYVAIPELCSHPLFAPPDVGLEELRCAQ